ncbi:type I restriction-modification system subunit M [Ignatzschineria larvae DSM 13226]|uniref:site-specific DNA-methyltransferase (adenine-specific) n=1 Tax=Ignatzschineria larvae DSM 13226 TaxID=1111732 RepID=A0ABZ3BY40_9GAMM|nr:type I restriction-modification system subunit M [Ignatzschineria larvae]
MSEQNSKTLYSALWASADILRSKMDANEYKNYLLGIIFYKYLSDKMLHYAVDQLEDEIEMLLPENILSQWKESERQELNFKQEVYRAAYENPEIQNDLKDALREEFSYVIAPDYTFTHLINEVFNQSFQLESLQQGFRNIEQSSEAFANLFQDIDLYSRKLGSTPQKQNETISGIMKALAEIDFAGHSGDILGDAYEYMIGQFASDSGKKAGEFYTPQPVAELMTKIVIHGKENQKGFSVYDPTMGSGSLMLNIKKETTEPNTVLYFGQEINTSTYNLARMNLMLHGVPIANQHLSNADTLDEDWPTEEPTNFDAVLMNPPYSADWSAAKGFLDDVRFAPYGVLAPKSKADFAFLLHGFYHLKSSGTMAIVLPHGVLFRGGAEEKIRKILLENGHIYAVIGLPSNIFFNTSIPTTIIVLKKDYDQRDVLFIDASNEFEKVRTQNILTAEHINKILQTYVERKTIDKYSYVASFEEIVENEFNLNIPRYVDTFEPEPEIPLADISADLLAVNSELQSAEQALFAMLDELTGTNAEAEAELTAFKAALKGE